MEQTTPWTQSEIEAVHHNLLVRKLPVEAIELFKTFCEDNQIDPEDDMTEEQELAWRSYSEPILERYKAKKLALIAGLTQPNTL